MSSDRPLPVLVATGLAREARLAAGSDIVTVCAGSSPTRLRIALGDHAPSCRAVVSFGIAGGLDPALAPGDVVVATGIAAADGHWPAHPAFIRAWVRCLSKGRHRMILAGIAAGEALLMSPAEKAALHSATGAAVVDLESHVAAAFAAAHGLPFAAIRAVCDPAHRVLPPLAREALRPDGRVDFASLLRQVVRQPTQLTALPCLASDASAAFASLRHCRSLLGPGLGLTGLGEPFSDVA
ncbi:phosphorylase [Microvirga massiliensis]|uniref:phosphorylase n=1 Tax=Microvirga massiliensis TaxID=1033741 RepID=UPI00093EFF52|nr:phosphorylase [Microvirga massiliensis]